MPADLLPTEILCTIFELSTVGLATYIPGVTSSMNTQLETHRRTPDTSPIRGQEVFYHTDSVALPSYKNTLRHCIAISQVCRTWRYIAVDMQNLWTGIYLCHRAFLSKDYHDHEAAEMTSTFLSRSGKSPLHLDITFAPPDARLGLSWIQKTRYEESIRRVLFSHIGRCQSLRVESDEFIITTILDLFLDLNLSPSNNSVYTPLSRLHLAKTISAPPVVSDPPDYGHQQPTFPPDLSVVAPHLTHLYVDGVQVAVFPRWSLERLYLTDLFVSYQNHFHIFMKTHVTTLVLHRVTIPGGIPYVRQILTYHPSSVTSLRLSELRCAGPEDEHQDIYALFFTLTPYRTLRNLELCGLSEDAMYGLTRMLMSNSELVFSEMRLLTLRNVKLIDTMVVPLTNATPGLNGLVLDSVGGGSRLLEVWRRDPGIWPQVTEVSMGEGESVQVRNDR